MSCIGNRHCCCPCCRETDWGITPMEQEGATDRRTYNCRPDRQVIKHQHIVNHRHDIINEYEVVHHHDYYYQDVVRTREVTKHHEHVPYNPNYCGEGAECET
ncbi:MAG: hypothetical protein FWG45_08045 [Oscillospiraceae bacterium]|nr:hypothetical protein [Oscillospiraceae bacterium]